MFDLDQHKNQIASLCSEFGVKRLEFFGSVLTEEFDADSDVDCLIEFDKSDGNYFHRYFDLKYALEKMLGRNVDLVVDSAIRNPYFRQSVDSSRRLIYAA